MRRLIPRKKGRARPGLLAVAAAACLVTAAAPAAGAAVTPASCTGIHISLLNGSQAMGFTSNTMGAQLINVAKPGRAFSFCSTGNQYRNLPVGNIQTSTGLEVATNNSCTGLVLKVAGSDGTAFALRTPGGGSTEFVSRPCDFQNRDPIFAVIASNNRSGSQWFVCNGPNGPACDTSGVFHALDLA